MAQNGSTLTVAIIAAGAMGAAVGRRLNEYGARVLTVTQGRSARTEARARGAGMIAVAPEAIAAADIVLSIAPPSEATSLAASLAPILRAAQVKPTFIDCNAINPETMRALAASLAGTGCAILDGAIIGPPPSDSKDPCFYISGDPESRCAPLAAHGLRLRRIDGPIGAAKTLKMVYAGINKGFVGLGAAMLLAAARAGCGDALRQELGESLPTLLARLETGVPDMYPKAYRWVGEMHEIADFLGSEDPASGYFKAAASVFAQLAADHDGAQELETALDAALGHGRG